MILNKPHHAILICSIIISIYMIYLIIPEVIFHHEYKALLKTTMCDLEGCYVRGNYTNLVYTHTHIDTSSYTLNISEVIHHDTNICNQTGFPCYYLEGHFETLTRHKNLPLVAGNKGGVYDLETYHHFTYTLFVSLILVGYSMMNVIRK